jgi:hypothetical protein
MSSFKRSARGAAEQGVRALMTISPQIKALRSTFIGAIVVTFLLCQRHAGFMVLFEAICVLVFVAISIWVSIHRPQQRSIQAAKVGVWLLSIGIVIGVHIILAERTKIDAQKIVDAIITYHASHGAYPPNIESIGYSESERKSMIGFGGYFFTNGQPDFFYASTYVPFETENFDFSKRIWWHSD